MYHFPNQLSSGSGQPESPRTVKLVGVAAVAFGIAAGAISYLSFQAARELDNHPNLTTARTVQPWVYSPSTQAANNAARICGEQRDASAGCLTRTEIAETAKQATTISIVTGLEATAALGLGALALGSRGGGNGSGQGGSPSPARRPEDAPYAPPQLIV